MTQKTAFVTGAASGIGKTIAKKLVEQGWLVAIADINKDALTQLESELGKNCRSFTLDVTSTEQWKQALQEFNESIPSLDLLVNNAGILASGYFENIPLEAQLKIADINFKGVLIGCHAAFPYLKKSTKACVVNLSSASAIYGQPSLATYSASKFAVRGLTESLNIEWEKYGIRVLDIMPLFVQTDMVTDMDAKAMTNLGVRLTTDDVANTVMKAAKATCTGVHWPVGSQANWAYRLSKLSPDWLSRIVNKRLAS